MINEQRTLEVFGYYSTDISKFSNKKIVYNCDRCNKEKLIRKADYSKGGHKFCKACGNKDGRSGFAINDYSGKNNGRYTTGYTLEKHYCIAPDCGKEISNRSKYCKNHALAGKKNPEHSKRMSGKNHPNWKGGISALHYRIRGIELVIIWRKAVFHRDNFICQKCGKTHTKLEAHHLKPFKIIFKEFLKFYSQFSPIEDKETLVRLSESWSEFWDVNNGITLCEECHKLEHAVRK